MELKQKQKDYHKVKLPNGMEILCLRKDEVKLVYEEVQAYLKHGIELQEGDVVFDVGANIGLFTLWVHWLKQDIKVYAFEPVPAIFDVLQANVERLDSKKLLVFPYGLSQESMTTTFAYYPNATITSRLYPGVSGEELNDLKQMIINNLKDLPFFVSWIRWLPPFLRSPIIDRKLTTAFQMEQVECQLKTLSAVIQEHKIEQIDLLKIDVEKSELDVLLGIDEADWHIIKQVFVEVHDLECRLEKIMALLKKHGLSEITVEKEPILKGSGTHGLYACRR